MAFSVVDSEKGLHSNNAGGGTTTVTLTGIAAGDIIVVGHTQYENGTQATIADDQLNTYETGISRLHAANSQRTFMRWVLTPVAATTIVTATYAVTPPRNDAVLFGLVLRGLTPTPQDTDSSEGDGTTVTGPTVTVTGDGIIIGLFGTMSNAPITATNGFTNIIVEESLAVAVGAMAYKAVSAGNDNPAWTKGSSTGNLDDWCSIAAVFGLAASGLPFITQLDSRRM